MHINLGVLRLPVPGGHFVYAVVYSPIIGAQIAIYANELIDVPGVAKGQVVKNFICLLPVVVI